MLYSIYSKNAISPGILLSVVGFYFQWRNVLLYLSKHMNSKERSHIIGLTIFIDKNSDQQWSVIVWSMAKSHLFTKEWLGIGIDMIRNCTHISNICSVQCVLVSTYRVWVMFYHWCGAFHLCNLQATVFIICTSFNLLLKNDDYNYNHYYW